MISELKAALSRFSRKSIDKADVFYLADFQKDCFEKQRQAVDLVCAGDSITGWNNVGDARIWPFKTYPVFLQELLNLNNAPIQVANCGIAGERSINGPYLIAKCLKLFPNAKQYVIGFGTNDLAMGELEVTSRDIVHTLESMIDRVHAAGKKAILLNVPYLNESRFPAKIAEQTHFKRDYHNKKLSERFSGKVPIVDICSKLKDGHFGDNLHPNETGAKIIAQAVYSELAKNMC